ncbi:hypothetical protein CCACVL1_25321 [Corchorus capsularis]|uniref:Uncharacterized protein n=1 Tax=Corchorus capsularis TaxID=210143 RepID=A0A1R3GLE6_COCAP|nr:hypothetical protein CCACVL1_25321 [Corchorus capsularis]
MDNAIAKVIKYCLMIFLLIGLVGLSTEEAAKNKARKGCNV